MNAAALAGGGILAGLSTLHVHWAVGGKFFKEHTAPERAGGSKAFEPGPAATIAVAAGLAVASAVVLANLGRGRKRRLAARSVGAVFALRAVGDFRSVGFSKRPADTAFARRDTRIYSPLCVVVALLAWAATR